jgi:TonB family protein
MKAILSVLFVLPLLALAQKIKVNEYDKFIKQQRVESEPIPLSTSPNMKLSLCLSAIGPRLYVQIIGAGKDAHRVDQEDQIIFLMDNDSTVAIKSKGYQGYDIGTTISTFKHSYVLTYSDLKKLSQNNLAALRKYHFEDYDDVDVSKEVSEKFKILCALFIVELLNTDLLHLVEAKAPEQATPTLVKTVAAQVQVIDTPTKAQADILPKTEIAKQKPAVPTAIAPAFPGGIDAWSAFLKKDLYPPTTLAEGEVREALVQFMVTANGTARDFKILQSAGVAFDKELLRVLKRSPNWKPALEDGQPVDATVTQRVVFVQPAGR